MNKSILDLIKERRNDILENVNENARNYIEEQDWTVEDIGECIGEFCEAFESFADDGVSVYCSDQKDYFDRHQEECERALLELYDRDSIADIISRDGLNALIEKAGACGWYQANLNDYYEAEREIKEATTLKCLENSADEFPNLTVEQLGDLMDKVRECNSGAEIQSLLMDLR